MEQDSSTIFDNFSIIDYLKEKILEIAYRTYTENSKIFVIFASHKFNFFFLILHSPEFKAEIQSLKRILYQTVLPTYSKNWETNQVTKYNRSDQIDTGTSLKTSFTPVLCFQKRFIRGIIWKKRSMSTTKLFIRSFDLRSKRYNRFWTENFRSRAQPHKKVFNPP